MNSFDEIKPIYYIDEEMNNILSDINKKLKNINVNDKQKRKYMISKSKIRSIHSSLAIEANSLSLFDVENISNNKQVFGKKDEVQEVKNAIEAYNHINYYNYKSENESKDDILPEREKFTVEEIKIMEDEFDSILSGVLEENNAILSSCWKEKTDTLLKRCIKYKAGLLFYIHDFSAPYDNNFMDFFCYLLVKNVFFFFFFF